MKRAPGAVGEEVTDHDCYGGDCDENRQIDVPVPGHCATCHQKCERGDKSADKKNGLGQDRSADQRVGTISGYMSQQPNQIDHAFT